MSAKAAWRYRAAACGAIVAACAGNAHTVQIGPRAVTSAAWRAVNRTASVVRDTDQEVVRIAAAPGGGMLWSPDVRFANGDIDIDVRGQDVLQQSFLGVAYRVANDSTFEVVWLRPFNFQAGDAERHAHAVQYAVYPDYGWSRLRKERPGVFESAVPQNILPDRWVHLHIEVRGAAIRVFLDHATIPTLSVTSPAPLAEGGIGLWIGDNSPGDFANWRITRTIR